MKVALLAISITGLRSSAGVILIEQVISYQLICSLLLGATLFWPRVSHLNDPAVHVTGVEENGVEVRQRGQMLNITVIVQAGNAVSCSQ